MSKIVSLGSALQDIYLIDRDDFGAEELDDKSVFGDIEIGTKVDIDKISYEVGGGGTNAAVSFSRHGHETVFLGNIGRDPAGEAVISTLDQENIDTGYIKSIPRVKTGCSVVLLDAKTGERTILTHRGASAKFDNLDEKALDEIQPDWLYITSLRGDMLTLLKFTEKAKELGAKIMFNPGVLEIKDQQRLLGVLTEIDVLLLNKSEAAEIVPGTILEELLSHLTSYVKTSIITDGSMGGIATDGHETYRFGIYEDVKVKDTTGAGDAFGSGFLAHYAAGNSFYDSLIFGSANSTSVVHHLGAKAGILTGHEELHPMPIQRI